MIVLKVIYWQHIFKRTLDPVSIKLLKATLNCRWINWSGLSLRQDGGVKISEIHKQKFIKTSYTKEHNHLQKTIYLRGTTMSYKNKSIHWFLLTAVKLLLENHLIKRFCNSVSGNVTAAATETPTEWGLRSLVLQLQTTTATEEATQICPPPVLLYVCWETTCASTTVR